MIHARGMIGVSFLVCWWLFILMTLQLIVMTAICSLPFLMDVVVAGHDISNYLWSMCSCL